MEKTVKQSTVTFIKDIHCKIPRIFSSEQKIMKVMEAQWENLPLQRFVVSTQLLRVCLQME
ncbi:hypothetical protein IQ13_0893 [Lacibacter cauensis]|uniref:Uncharacterized protein n=1 Tax=Lacibacter cauensis TaxID=510947 RepID=A0A562SXI1_9BACT|nr:hypothetical protein IQ13_0893 [Lacibacter cauensis]